MSLKKDLIELRDALAYQHKIIQDIITKISDELDD